MSIQTNRWPRSKKEKAQYACASALLAFGTAQEVEGQRAHGRGISVWQTAPACGWDVAVLRTLSLGRGGLWPALEPPALHQGSTRATSPASVSLMGSPAGSETHQVGEAVDVTCEICLRV
ncbi:hypothetical protein VULLAG_LOCUS11782 [Vulpes lagopus]